MKKILFLSHCYPSYKDDVRGIFFRYWISELNNSNCQFYVITPSWDKSKKMKRSVGDYGEIIWRFPWNKKLGELNFKNIFDIMKFFYFLIYWKRIINKIYKKESKWDLVIAAWGIPAGILLNNKSLKNSYKVIWWLGSDFHKFKKGILKLILKYISNQANQNWTDSKEICRGLKNISKAKIKFVPNQPISFKKVKTKQFNKFPKILSIGRLEKVKNFEFGIKAVNHLLSEGFDLNYEIIGEGPEMSNLLSVIDDQNKIKLLGFKNKDFIFNKLKETDILLITSITEGATNVFFEALSSGTIVVSTDVGDIKEATANTKIGITSPQGDLNGLINNIKKAINGELRFNNKEAERIFFKYSSLISINNTKNILEKI